MSIQRKAHRSAAAHIDRTLGFGRIPAADSADPEAVRLLADSTEARPVAEYSRRERDQMAVLDYIIGNYDRGPRSWRTGRDGTPIAIDHGHCFPERTTEIGGIRSDFVDRALGVPLDAQVLAAVRAVDINRMWIELLSVGVSSTASAAALARLSEVAARGMITGQAWPRILPGAHDA